MADSSADRDPLDVLAEEFVARFRAGERPSLTEFAGRRPDLAADIRELFPALVEIEQLKPVTADHTGDFTPASEPSDPARIGEFRILRRVGYGGMGVVYEAVQESLGRHVALKLLPAEALADAKRLERFRREAKAAARLHHTNIVPVFGTGAADGRHYYAMQFIAGHPLDAVINEVRRLKDKSAARTPRAVSEVAAALMTGTFAKAGAALPSLPPSPGFAGEGMGVRVGLANSPLTPDPSPAKPGEGGQGAAVAHASGSALSLSDSGRHYWATVARVGAQAADALAYAHAQGVLHRDIKPANLLLDLQGTLWVTDFGLAKSTDADDLTHAGDVVGTLRYLAPERFEGAGDHRADVYALGLTLYELLTLKPAFHADNRAKLLQEVTAATPPPPRAVNAAIPRDLETVVLKAIARDPALRYQSAAELADDLRRYGEDRPILARRATAFEQTWRWCRRNPAVASLLAAVVLVTAAGFAATVSQMNAARDNAARADASARQAEERADEVSKEKKAQEQLNAELAAKQVELARTLYAAHLSLVPAAAADDHAGRVLDLLEPLRPKAGEPDLRGFEWHYWKRQVHREIAAFRPPTDRTFRTSRASFGVGTSWIILSGDGTRVAAFDSLGLRVWDVASTRPLVNHPDLTPRFDATAFSIGRGSEFAFSGDGRRVAAIVAAADDDSAARVAAVEIDTATAYVAPLPGSAAQDFSLAFSPDGTRLAVASAAGRNSRRAEAGHVAVHDLAAGRALLDVALPNGPGRGGVRFGPDGRRLFVDRLALGAGGPEGRGTVLDAATGAVIDEPPPPLPGPPLSPDGRLRAVLQRRDRDDFTNAPAKLRVVNAADDNEVWAADVPAGMIRFFFSADAALLVGVRAGARTTEGGRDAIRVWDAATGAPRPAPAGLTDPPIAAAFRPDGRLVTLDGGGAVKTWDLSPPPTPAPMPLPTGGSFGVGIIPGVTPDGRFSAGVSGTGRGDGGEPRLAVRDETGRERFAIPFAVETGPRNRHVYALSPDGSRLAVALLRQPDEPVPLAVHDVAGGGVVWRVELPAANTGGIAASSTMTFSPDGRWLAYPQAGPNPFRRADAGDGAGSAVVIVFDAATGREACRLPVPGEVVVGTAFHPDGRRLAVCGRSVATRRERPATVARMLDLVAPAMSRDQPGATVQLFDLPAAAAGLRYDIPLTRPAGFHYSPDGRWLAAASRITPPSDRGAAAWLWRADGGPVRELPGSGAQVYDLAFAPDGRRVATLGRTGVRREVKLWDPEAGRELLTLPQDASAAAVRFSADGHLLYVFDKDGRRAYDARPLAPEVEAADIADRLPRPRPDRPAAAAAELDSLALAPPLRAQVAALAQPRAPWPPAPGRSRTLLGLPPGRPEAEYRRELDAVLQSLEQSPNSPGFLTRAGMARYRLGQYAEAAADFAKAAEQLRGSFAPPVLLLPGHAYEAMALFRLGRVADAKAALAKARDGVGSQTTPDFLALLAEAEALVDPKP